MQDIHVKMTQAGCSQAQVERFCARVRHFLSGDRASISEEEIEPIESLPGLQDVETNQDLLRKVAVVKLNGGLGTSMGLTGPKGLLEVKDGLDFYAILFAQVQSFRQSMGFQPPLLFMNSFSTEAATRDRLKALSFEQDLPWDFLQSQVPKITEDGGLPDSHPEHAWCPPGHGDIYASLLDSGLKTKLLDAGIRYLFVSNIDNLGATLDSRPLNFMEQNKLSFLMEVTRRGESDKKGGHLAKDKRGKLLLREVAQCPHSDLVSFQNVERHRFFNTNNLWINLEEVDESWTDLPLIVNRKPLVPHLPETLKVVQLEQAMGAAIGVARSTGAIEVSRERFLPVKTTNDLFSVRSDIYQLDPSCHLVRQGPRVPQIDLDPEHFKMIQDFERLVTGLPSLREVRRLTVRGPVSISADMKWGGDVHLVE